MYTIREACREEIPAIMAVIEAAIGIMRASGNVHQWKDGYPSEEVIGNDEGRWLEDTMPYHVVHRVASYPQAHGIFRTVMDWCFERERVIRIDTHRDNRIMQHCIESYGFTYCGIIYLASGDERLAYQLIKN